ncbi:MAG: SDR family oxidoreductase [Leptospiraceae bacterium]|nr:SDR family oxidoreductase [Leptospiraceae bacterium]MCB1200784.1 SDR family oxidoreductase [Leptospiraceae bacterium]
MIDYSGKNILITGGSKGIGRAISLQLAEAGANLMIVARDLKALKEVINEIKELKAGKVAYYSADVTNKGQIKKAVQETLKQFGKIDGVIHNAGFARPDYFENLSLEIFEKHVNVDYMGAINVLQAAFPYLSNGAFISVTSSVVGYMGVFGYTAYAGPKFALIGFAQSLRQELKPKGISISVLCPPDTHTPGYEQENETKPFETAALSEGASLMQPEQVAKVFLKGLQRRRFMILCNFESKLFYRLQGWFPGLVRIVMDSMISKAQKKKILKKKD